MTRFITPKIASIACILRSGENLSEVALQQSLTLAAHHGAHLTVQITTQHLAATYSPIWMSFPAALVAEANAKSQTRAMAAADTVRNAARLAGVIADVHDITDKDGNAAESAVRSARASDLIVVDQPETVLDAKAMILEEALFRSGRPVLVATPKRAPFSDVNMAMLAWDGTSHAARAAGDLFSVFHKIKQIDIVSVLGDKDMSSTLPGADLARHLARKGLQVNVVEVSRNLGSVAELLDGHASKSGAEIIAMGGYGHSRLRQFVMGGVTSTIILNASTPLLMSY
jgi:nucleotide-binding universal stress UspA family protein